MDSDRDMQCRQAHRGDSTFALISFRAVGAGACLRPVDQTALAMHSHSAGQAEKRYVVAGNISGHIVEPVEEEPRHIQAHSGTAGVLRQIFGRQLCRQWRAK